jgi:hypothetical protein
MNMSENQHHARIDYMSWPNMQKIHDLVECVRRFVSTNPNSDTEQYIRDVVERIDDVFDDALSDDNAYRIVLILRGLAAWTRSHRAEENDHQVIVTTGDIIKLVQGDNKMNDKLKLGGMIYRRVERAVQEMAHGNDTSDTNVIKIANQWTEAIVEDVFGGKVSERIAEGAVRSGMISTIVELTRMHPELSIEEIVEMFPEETEGQPEFVDQFYLMDPVDEDVLHNGTLVIDGMKVLIESPTYREKIHPNMSAGDTYDALKNNRWATVTESKIVDHGNGINSLAFVGVYDDGVKMKIDQPVNLAWIVKKDSIPRIDSVLGSSFFGGRPDSVLYSDTTANIVRDMKSTSPEERRRYKIQLGQDGDVMSVDEYLIAEGAMAGKNPEDSEPTYDVVAPAGDIVFNGTATQTIQWLTLKSIAFRADCLVGRVNSEDLISGAAFLSENDA